MRGTKTQRHGAAGLIILVVALVCPLCLAQELSSKELINNAAQHDGQTVIFSGEVIGDMMVRGGYTWVNVNDGINAVGIWIRNELTRDINYMGSYHTKGDSVEFVGRFNRACFEHGGDLDIHAQSIIKISPGGQIPHPVNKEEIKLIFWIFGAIAVFGLLRLIRRKLI